MDERVGLSSGGKSVEQFRRVEPMLNGLRPLRVHTNSQSLIQSLVQVPVQTHAEGTGEESSGGGGESIASGSAWVPRVISKIGGVVVWHTFEHFMLGSAALSVAS